MTNNRLAQESPVFLLAVILLTGLFIRIWGLWEYQYNPDELEFIIIAKGETLAEVFRRGLAELHPPLFHFTRHWLVGTFGDDPFIQRLFSVAAGLIAILGMYQFGLRLRGALLGLFLAAGMALMPVAVSTSMTIRNYAFFMAFTSWALVFFADYRRDGRGRDLFWFSLLMMLAAAFHFGGFIVAAICGIGEALRTIWQRNWRGLLIFSLSYLPLFTYGLSLYPYYLAPGATIPRWDHFIEGTVPFGPGGSLLGVLGYFLPFLNLLKHHQLDHAGVTMFFVMASGITLMVLQIVGIVRMRRESFPLFLLILAAWLVALSGLAHRFMFSGTRHMFYFLPFFLIALWYAIEPLAVNLWQRRHAPFITAVAIVLIGLTIKASHYYEWYGEEFSLKHKDYNEGQTYLDSHLKPKDVIVTGRIAAYFYLLYNKDKGATPYDAYGDFPYLNNTLLLAAYDPPIEPYTTWHPFHDALEKRLAEHVVPAESKVWFVMFGAKNVEIWHLMECPDIRPDIRDFFSRDNVVIFNIRANRLATFLKNTAAWERCYADYEPMINAHTFEAVSLKESK